MVNVPSFNGETREQLHSFETPDKDALLRLMKIYSSMHTELLELPSSSSEEDYGDLPPSEVLKRLEALKEKIAISDEAPLDHSKSHNKENSKQVLLHVLDLIIDFHKMDKYYSLKQIYFSCRNLVGEQSVLDSAVEYISDALNPCSTFLTPTACLPQVLLEASFLSRCMEMNTFAVIRAYAIFAMTIHVSSSPEHASPPLQSYTRTFLQKGVKGVETSIVLPSGLRSKELADYSQADLEKIPDLLNEEHVMEPELKHLLQNKKKAEVLALGAFGSQFAGKVFMPFRLKQLILKDIDKSSNRATISS
ncbi:hypothetical protein ACLB2K_005026 [Fragaria x ananassa]